MKKFEEWLCDGYYYGVEAVLLEEIHSAHQRIEVLQHSQLGKMLRIDGALQCSEADEAWYHEPLVHAVMAHAKDNARVLIVGGGDGGAAEEVLKWSSVLRLEQVEIDEQVIVLSRKHLRFLHKGLLDINQNIDPRFILNFGDGLAKIQQLKRDAVKVDALILDLTDPGGPSLPLWNTSFFNECAHVLGAQGVMGLHVGAPWAQQKRCKDVLAALRQSFPNVKALITDIPVSGGPWMMAVATGAYAKQTPSVEKMQHQFKQLNGPALAAIDARILHGMLDIAHRW